MMEAFYPSLLEWIDHARETADVAWVKPLFGGALACSVMGRAGENCETNLR